MTFNSIGRCFVSFRIASGFLLFALHRRWRLDFVRPPAKPGYRRWYVGPLEIEHAAIAPLERA